MTPMLLAAALFLGTHLGISSTGLRGQLVKALGERGYVALYVLLAFATLGYLIWLYNGLPRYEYYWMPSPALYLTAKLLMPIALIFAVGGFLVKNPTNLGMERLLRDGAGIELARGVTRITRHPFQWGVLLWATAHLIANGDTNSVVFFGTFVVLSSLGTVLLDRKKAAASGADWQAYAEATSNFPFLAIIQGRNRLAPGEMWQPLLAGLAVYALLFWGHEWVGGVRIV